MNRVGPAALYAASYTPSMEDLRKCLPEVGQRTEGQLAQLHHSPTPERCDRMLIELEGVLQLVRRLREAMLREGGGHGQGS
jgi:hypothetical protein